MGHSVKTNLNKEDAVSELLLSVNADVNHENVFLVVEGIDDAKFWNFISSDNVIIFESYSGKQGVYEIISEFFTDDPRVIGIRDRDYELVNLHPKIFFYDFSCLEMMLISSDKAFKSICSDYYFGDINPIILRHQLLGQLKFISLFRQYNEVNGWGINFKGISINDSFCTRKKKIDQTLLKEALIRVNESYFKNMWK